MGSRIAELLAESGMQVLLLDLTAEAALRGAAAGVTASSFDDGLPGIQECDWVVEAVAENLAVKRALYERIAVHRRRSTPVTTNTSGIPLRSLVEGFGAEFRQCFAGVHFFNPPKVLHLVELVPGPETRPEILDALEQFCTVRLRKGVVRCKDTPNFIANRIGANLSAIVQREMIVEGLSIEEADWLTGPLIGLPKSATFRLIDVIGLDVWAQVTKNVPDGAALAPFLEDLLQRGWLGRKSGQGCYRKAGKEAPIEVLDWRTLEYHPLKGVQFDPALLSIEPIAERLQAAVATYPFVRKVISEHITYAAGLIPEIADHPHDIDRAMRWGYGHALGPFEMRGALGPELT